MNEPRAPGTIQTLIESEFNYQPVAILLYVKKPTIENKPAKSRQETTAAKDSEYTTVSTLE